MRRQDSICMRYVTNTKNAEPAIQAGEARSVKWSD